MPASGSAFRVGVCGSGYWAEAVHLPAIAATPGLELKGVWGRTEPRPAVLAEQFSISSFHGEEGFLALLEQVDIVTFAIAPDAQAPLALKAARAGKHLLLEKPIASDLAAADELEQIIEEAGIGCVTFLTHMFNADVQQMIARAKAIVPTSCDVEWRSRALLPNSPFQNSVWRNKKYGTLWDLGPHVLSVLQHVFGPVVLTEGSRDGTGLFDLTFIHAGGANSHIRLSQMDAQLQVGRFEQYVFQGDQETITGGNFNADKHGCFQAALQCLRDTVETGATVPWADISYNRDMVAVLDAASESIENGGQAVRVGGH